jgi:protein-S-isoprenylcysteine O-methyltransferase Ste14
MTTIQLIGFLIVFSFYGSYFAKQRLQRTQGISTDRLGRGNKPKKTLVIEVSLKITTFSMAGVQLGSIMMDTRWLSFISSNALRYTGIAAALAGTMIFIVAMATMRNSWRAGVDASQKTELVTDGLYRFSRNPAFLGFNLFYLGITLAFCNPVSLLFFVLCAALLHLQIVEEEKFLTSAFGGAYLQYRKHTGRYVTLFLRQASTRS